MKNLLPEQIQINVIVGISYTNAMIQEIAAIETMSYSSVHSSTSNAVIWHLITDKKFKNFKHRVIFNNYLF